MEIKSDEWGEETHHQGLRIGGFLVSALPSHLSASLRHPEADAETVMKHYVRGIV